MLWFALIACAALVVGLLTWIGVLTWRLHAQAIVLKVSQSDLRVETAHLQDEQDRSWSLGQRLKEAVVSKALKRNGNGNGGCKCHYCKHFEIRDDIHLSEDTEQTQKQG